MKIRNSLLPNRRITGLQGAILVAVTLVSIGGYAWLNSSKPPADIFARIRALSSAERIYKPTGWSHPIHQFLFAHSPGETAKSLGLRPAMFEVAGSFGMSVDCEVIGMPSSIGPTSDLGCRSVVSFCILPSRDYRP
jgi:hypothetical protein